VKYYLGPLLSERGTRFFSEPRKGLTPSQANILRQVIQNKIVVWDRSDANQRGLLRSCILEKARNGLTFSTPLHRRFFFRRAYPVQPSEKPEDIDEWLLSVLRKFGSDALELKESHGTGRDFPKERGILQNEFYRCAFESIPPSVTLAVETSQLTWSSVKIKGSLDFWVDSNLCWAIELMRLGTSTTIQEHENRFDEESGKYSPLEPTVARVVDFRKPGDVPQTGSDIYVAVVFHEGYLGADVYFYEKNKVNRKETVKFGV